LHGYNRGQNGMNTRSINGGAMVSSTGSGPSRQFERRLISQGDRKLIESTCRRCGTVIVGSITDGLAADEENHVKDCRSKPKRPTK
jgi:hypothetical protein